jgi:hypothetical protein
VAELMVAGPLGEPDLGDELGSTQCAPRSRTGGPAIRRGARECRPASSSSTKVGPWTGCQVSHVRALEVAERVCSCETWPGHEIVAKGCCRTGGCCGTLSGAASGCR